MDFEQWWKKEHFGKDYDYGISQAQKAWQASRENQQELTMDEFCQTCDTGEPCCSFKGGKCAVEIDYDCQYTAKEFAHWLKENGCRIVKDA